MAKVSEKVQEAIFNQLSSQPANSECADCSTSSPTWVSLDFGVFLCMRCSGVHRQIGPHITRVRSIRLDGWTKENIEIMATVGNKIANAYYEHSMSGGYRRPSANSSPEECRRFVDEKYINKKFVPKSHPEPVKDFVACRTKGTKPDFSYAGPTQKKEEHVRTLSSEKTHVPPQLSLRKKSLSLSELPVKTPTSTNKVQQHYEDLLSADHDLLGSNSNQTQTNTQATSTIPAPKKINFANFKKANNEAVQQQQQQPEQEIQSQDDWSCYMNATSNQETQSQQQASTPAQVDLKQLYNQGGHQNQFVQGYPNQYFAMNQGGYNGHYNMGIQQNNVQFNCGYSANPGYNQQMGGFQQQAMNFNGMGGVAQMGYTNNFMQNQQGYSQYQSSGFNQQQNNNDLYF